MKIINNPNRKDWNDILKRPTFTTTSLDSILKEVFEEVSQYGDKALKKFTKRFDKVE